MSRPEPSATSALHAALTRLDEPEPLKSILPRPLSPVVGREDDIRTCVDLLTVKHTRLLTLTGPGGVGKTRLALAVADASRHDFPHGVVFVSLAEIADTDLVLPALERALGVKEESGRTSLERLTARLEPLRALLVLDNLEHVLSIAPHLANLLQGCPGLALLVTSRVSLRVRGEIEHQVLPLALPDLKMLPPPEELSVVEAVALFMQTVQGYNTRFQLTPENAMTIGEICHRLDGLPLAIELAASRLRSLTPEALLRLLDHRLSALATGPADLPERQRTLRETIRWSYDLLSPAEQLIFRAGSTFTGSFDRAALGALTGLHTPELTDSIERLLDHHLVRRLDILSGEPRYWMLETIREFGQEMSANLEETSHLLTAHAAYFGALASEAAPHFVAPDQVTWLDRLEHDHENARSALLWLTDHDPAAAARMVHDLWRFWWWRGYVRQGLSLAQHVLQRRDEIPDRERALLLYASGELHHCLSELDPAESLLLDALGTLRSLDEQERTAACLNALGIVARDRGQLRQAEALHEEALPLAETSGDSRQVANTLNNLAAVSYYLGNAEEARARWEQAVEILRHSGDRRAFGMVLGNLGVIEGALGNIDRAIELKEESLQLAQELRDIEAILTSIASLSGVLFQKGDLDRAETLIEEALPQTEHMGDARIRATMLHTLGMIVGNRGDHPRAAAHFSESLLLLARTGNMPGVATDLEGLARTASVSGFHDDAIRLFAAADAIREQTGAVRESVEDREDDTDLTRSRSSFTRAQADELWKEGREWTLDDIVAASAALPECLASGPPAVQQPAPGKSRDARPFGLTQRELQILGYLVRHHTDREIGDALYISPRTVTTHVTSIINKLGVATRREAARLAEELKLFEPG